MSEIKIPEDATETTFTTMTAQYDLVVYLQPCVVDSYFDSITISEIEYFIGTPTLTGGPYEFEQSPMCGYAETVTITNLPNFVQHNEANADFTIPANSDLALIDEYTVTIKAEI